jgi:hypothetical protein
VRRTNRLLCFVTTGIARISCGKNQSPTLFCYYRDCKEKLWEELIAYFVLLLQGLQGEVVGRTNRLLSFVTVEIARRSCGQN